MHPHTRVTATEITKTILVLLGGGAVIIVGLGLNPHHAHKLPLALAHFSVRRIRQTMRRLRLQGHVRYDPQDKTAPITLTKKGMERAARYTLRDFFRGKRRWDYLWRLVMFDIPERLRGKRLALQRTLLLAGFYPLQKSVFVSPYPCEKELPNHWICCAYAALCSLPPPPRSAKKRTGSGNSFSDAATDNCSPPHLPQ